MDDQTKVKGVSLEDLQISIQDVYNKGFGNVGTCSTEASTAAKEVTLGTIFELSNGCTLLIKFTNGISSENSTLAVTHTTLAGTTTTETAKPIYYKGATLGANLVQAGSSVLLYYDGTSFNIVGDLNTDTTYSVMGASGSTHASGLVPDTPTTAGTTKFLREDGTWAEVSSTSEAVIGKGTCSTAASTEAKEVTVSNDFNLVSDALLIVKFTNGISVANATLSVNSGTAIPIYYRGAALEADVIEENDSVWLKYNGTQFELVGGAGSGDTYESLPAESEGTDLSLVTTGEKYTWNNKQDTISDLAQFGNGIGTCNTSSGTAMEAVLSGYELVKNGFVAITFTHDVPANATLSVNSKTAKPIYYNGATLIADTIKAGDTALFGYDGTNYVLVSSGSVKLVEYLTVVLTSNQTNPNSDLIGATVVIKDAEDDTTLFSTTWQGTALDFEIPTGTEYNVIVGAVSGYATPSQTTHFAGVNRSRTDTFVYNTEIVTVTATTSDSAAVTGQKVKINNVEYTLDSTGVVSAKVAYGTSYSVKGTNWSGTITGGAYKRPAEQTFTAGQTSRSVSAVWTWVAEAVDLGLPSGLLWCSHNVGATNPEDVGLYFAWGDITGYAKDSGHSFSQSNYDATQVNGTYIKDIEANLSLEFDAANANMGGDWRMMINRDFTELNSNTTKSSYTLNGVDGLLLTSNINGNTLFLPNTGFFNGTTFGSSTQFLVWTNRLNVNDSTKAYYMRTQNTNLYNNTYQDRYKGFCVRAVI